MKINISQLFYGLLTFLPKFSEFHSKGTGVSSSRYCYSVWLRHLVHAYDNKIVRESPRFVGELGPGDSLGVLLSALLSGASHVYGLDAVAHISLTRNLKIFDELVDLFKRREPIPCHGECVNYKPALTSYLFPSKIISQKNLEENLQPDRLEKIANSIRYPNERDSMINYAAPWQQAEMIKTGTLDMILSQAVLEHVDDLDGAYRAMDEWLKPEGFISHQIDFKSHGLTDAWNGHWALPDLLWKLIRGRRPYLLNRQPYSAHRKLLDVQGFKLVNEILVKQPSVYNKSQLAPRFRAMTEDDLTTSGAFIQAVKP